MYKKEKIASSVCREEKIKRGQYRYYYTSVGFRIIRIYTEM